MPVQMIAGAKTASHTFAALRASLPARCWESSSAQSVTCLSSHMAAEKSQGHSSVLCLVSATHMPLLSSIPSWAVAICSCRSWLAHEGATRDTWCTGICCTWTSPFVHQKTRSYKLARIYHSWLILPSGGFSCTWHLPMCHKKRGFSSASKPQHKLTSVADLQLHSLYFEATISHLCNIGWLFMQCKALN